MKKIGSNKSILNNNDNKYTKTYDTSNIEQKSNKRINTHLKKFLLLTFSKVDKMPERQSIDRKKKILMRIRCHEMYYHYYRKKIAWRIRAPSLPCWNTSGRRDTKKKYSILTKNNIPWVRGAQLNIYFHIPWASVCKYVLKED